MREDNADTRLTEKGRELGLVDDVRWEAFSKKQELVETELARLKNQWVNPNSINADKINELLKKPMQRESTLEAMIRRPEVTYETLMKVDGLGPAISDRLKMRKQVLDYHRVELLNLKNQYYEHQYERVFLFLNDPCVMASLLSDQIT